MYSLVLVDLELCCDHYEEVFFIGVFESKQQAKDVAEYYITKVPGFCEYPCNYRIEAKEVHGKFNTKIHKHIWIVWGWNVNKNGDEIDIIESKYHLTKESAIEELNIMKAHSQRMEWTIDQYEIGEQKWNKGFVRE